MNYKITNTKKSILFILILIIGWIYWGNTSITITQIDINNSQIPNNFKEFIIVQISDLHNKQFGNKQNRLLSALNKTKPDIIVITGDLIDSNHTDINIAMEFVESAKSMAPIYYVTGNHEAWSEQYSQLHNKLLEKGVIILNNTTQKVEINNQYINLIGLDDPDFISDNYSSTLSVVSQKLNLLTQQTKGYTILLSHRPELFDIYCNTNINLVLSGHAHGGQFRLPFIGGLVAPNQGFFPKYTKGLYQNNDTQMIVSCGLGNSIIPIRINNRPEIVKITLK